MAKITITNENEIKIREVMLNLIGEGNCSKMFNKQMNAEVNYYGPNEIEIIDADTLESRTHKFNKMTPTTILEVLPVDGWYYGYIEH